MLLQPTLRFRVGFFLSPWPRVILPRNYSSLMSPFRVTLVWIVLLDGGHLVYFLREAK